MYQYFVPTGQGKEVKELVVSENKDIIEYLLPEEQEKIAELKAELIYPLKVMNHGLSVKKHCLIR